MSYIQEDKTIKMNGQNTPGSGVPSAQDSFRDMMEESNNDPYKMRAFKSYDESDLNGAWVPDSKEEGSNLKLTEQDIQYRFCLDDSYDG